MALLALPLGCVELAVGASVSCVRMEQVVTQPQVQESARERWIVRKRDLVRVPADWSMPQNDPERVHWQEVVLPDQARGAISRTDKDYITSAVAFLYEEGADAEAEAIERLLEGSS